MDAQTRVPFQSAEDGLKSALTSLRPDRVRQLLERLQERAWAHAFTYDRDDGRRQLIPLMVSPLVLGPPEHARLGVMATHLRHILIRVLPFALSHPRLRTLVPLEPGEEEFIARVHSPALDRDWPLASRLDVDVDFADPRWPDTSVFFEINGVAVGGFYYSMASENLTSEVVFPALDGAAVGLRPGSPIPEMVLGELVAQARRLGCQRPTIAYMEDRTWTTGITEAPSLIDLFAARGIRTVLADPRELEVRAGSIYLGDTPIDIVYRNMELRDLVEMETTHGPLPGVEKAFRENRVVSGLHGDLDHKSLWELLHAPELSAILDAGDHAFIQGHVPWTRLIRPALTTDPEGRTVDLIGFVEAGKDRLVIKPNRDCGGHGVTLGPLVDAAAWRATLEHALADPGRWICQLFRQSTRRPFAMDRDDRFHLEDLHTTYGLVATVAGFGCLGRASRAAVVNVSQGGGVFPLFIKDP